MKIWDLPTRVYHWLQAILFVGLIVTGFYAVGPHVPLGLGLFTLVIWRLIWGVIGSETSRFKQFVRSPKILWQYLCAQQELRPGHNPAGGWMVMSLLACLLLQCISGLALAGFFDNLPFAEWWLTDGLFDIFVLLHGWLFYLLPLLVSIHIAAVIGYKLCNKPLVLAMMTGYQAKYFAISVRFESNSKALLVLIAALLVTIAIVAYS